MSITERITTGNTRTDLAFGYVISGAMFAVSGPVWGGAAAVLNTALVVLYAVGARRNRAATDGSQGRRHSDLWTCLECHTAYVDVPPGQIGCDDCGEGLVYYGELEWTPRELVSAEAVATDVEERDAR